ncbi:hypothetical protein [Pseudonocardia xishanensis]|uniref:hypothetical protein n=1 Tax=Pseudonocardia xishanensis TaxID=630995 RepID=UPI0031EECC92
MSDESDPPTESGPTPPGISLRAGFALSELDLAQLWIASLTLGGTLSQAELEAALRGELSLSGHEHDVVAQAINDYFTERGQNHPVAYSVEIEERSHRRHPG